MMNNYNVELSMNKTHYHSGIFVLLCLLLAACNSTPPTTIMERPDGNCIGRVCDRNGRPVAGASVQLVPEGYLPSTNKTIVTDVNSTTSNAQGYFGFSVNSSGKYNLLASGGNLYGLRKSLPLNKDRQMELPEEVLREPGSLSGAVHMEEMEGHCSAVILLKGTSIYISPDTATGEFSLSNLAAGEYDLRVIAPEYSVIDTMVIVVSGVTTKSPAFFLVRKKLPKIDQFTATYDPLMMEVSLTWTTSDTDQIDSFHLYCNREQNILPILAFDKNTTSAKIDLLFSPVILYAYQIAPVGHDGWESPSLSAKPFTNSSAVVSQKLIRPAEMNSAKVMGSERFHSTKFGNYYFKQDGLAKEYQIFKMTSDLVIEKSVSYSGEITSANSNITSDAQGNIYFLTESFDTLSSNLHLIKCDPQLNLLDTFEFPHGRGPHSYSLAISGSGTILLYNNNGTIQWKPAANDTTIVTVLAPDFSTISQMVYPDCRQILQSVITGDSVTVVIGSNAWGKNRIIYFDSAFTVIGTGNPLEEMVVPNISFYGPENILYICGSNLFITGCYPVINKPTILYFFNSDNKIVARYNSGSTSLINSLHNSSMAFFSDNNGNLYDIGYVVRYSIDQIINTIEH
jgi:hypothetical protein